MRRTTRKNASSESASCPSVPQIVHADLSFQRKYIPYKYSLLNIENRLLQELLANGDEDPGGQHFLRKELANELQIAEHLRLVLQLRLVLFCQKRNERSSVFLIFSFLRHFKVSDIDSDT